MTLTKSLFALRTFFSCFRGTTQNTNGSMLSEVTGTSIVCYVTVGFQNKQTNEQTNKQTNKKSRQ